jgi:O-antigen/teichoic acid export membrane protein
LLRATIRNFTSQFFGLLVSVADRFVLAAILLRAWPTDLVADWTTIMAVSSLLGLADLGFVIFVGNRLQRAFALKDGSAFQRLVGSATFIYGTLGILLLAVAVSLALIQANTHFLTIRRIDADQSGYILLFLGIAQCFHTAKSALTQIYRGRGEYARGVIIDGISMLCIVCSAIVAVLFGAHVYGLALLYVASNLLFGWGLLVLDLRHRFPEISLWPLRPNSSELLDAARAMRWYALSYALPNIWLQAPVLLLSAFGIGGISLVSFVMQRTLVNFGRTFAVMLSMSTGVQLASHVHAGNKELIEEGISATGRSVAAVGGAIAAALLVFGSSVLQMWTGKSNLFDPAMMAWLVASSILVAPAIPLLYLAHLADMPQPQALAQLVQTVVALSLAMSLANTSGASGVAFSLAAGETLGIGLVLPLLVTKRLGITYWRSCFWSLVIAIATFAWSGVVGVMILSSIGTQGTLRMCMSIAAWCPLTFAPILLVLLPARYYAQLKEIASPLFALRRF